MELHGIVHIEWSSTDLGRSRTFFEGLFGWTFKTWDESYWMFEAPGGLGGGIARVDKVESGQSPCVYVLVNSIEPYLEKAKSLGGGVAMGKSPVGEMGFIALLTDPDGSVVGLFEPAPGP
jgi:predicted enzyme related to lactoylglutathione lyase